MANESLLELAPAPRDTTSRRQWSIAAASCRRDGRVPAALRPARWTLRHPRLTTHALGIMYVLTYPVESDRGKKDGRGGALQLAITHPRRGSQRELACAWRA